MSCLLATALFVATAYSSPAPLQMFAANGLIAHNSQYPGSLFDDLQIGDELEYCGKVYIVTEIRQYQAVTVNDFIDLDTKEKLKGSALYRKMYSRQGEIVLQTCIRKGNNWEWGRLFVKAEKWQ